MHRLGGWQGQVWRLSGFLTAVALVLGLALPAYAAPAAGLDELQAYAEQVKPIHENIIAIAQEDAAIFKEYRAGNRDALCDGRLAANAEELAGLRAQMAAITPPEEATQLHARFLVSLDDYGRGTDFVADFCETGVKVNLVRAALAVASARVKYGASIIEYDLLLLQAGLEEFMAGYEGSDFQALIDYGVAIGPAYVDWAELMAAEGPAIDAALHGQPQELCTMDVAGDAPLMQAITADFEAASVPEVASDVHQVLMVGAQAWLQALGHSGDYCEAETAWEQAIYLGTALSEFGVGAVGFADALVQYGDALEEAWKALW